MLPRSYSLYLTLEGTESPEGKREPHRAHIFFRILPADPAAPREDHSLLPPSEHGWVSPTDGPRGTIFYFGTSDWKPGEFSTIYALKPDGTKQTAPFQTVADQAGNAGAKVEFHSDITDPLGVYTLVFEGDQGSRSVLYMRLIY